MTPEQESQLTRLLKLKRYEQPPPGYFNSFSRRVMDRLAAGEADQRETLRERLFRAMPGLERAFGVFEAKPALAGAFGALVCALSISGIVFSGRPDSIPASLVAAPTETGGVHDVIASSLALDPLATPTTVQPMLVSSTNPVPPSGGTLFDQYLQLDAQRVVGH